MERIRSLSDRDLLVEVHTMLGGVVEKVKDHEKRIRRTERVLSYAAGGFAVGYALLKVKVLAILGIKGA